MALLVALATLPAAQCSAFRPTAVQVGGFAIRRVDEGTAETDNGSIALLPGDWLLDGEDLHVVVAGMSRPESMRGAVLEARLRSEPIEEGIAELAPRFLVDNTSARFDVSDIDLVTRDHKPALRIRGLLRMNARALVVERELSISRVAGVLSIVTRVAADHQHLSHVRMGEHVGWGGGTPWLEGIGPISGENSHSVDFVGIEGKDVSTVFAALDGDVDVHPLYEVSGTSRTLLGTDIWRDGAGVDDAHALVTKEFLALAPRSFGQAVRHIGWARGRAYPEVVATMRYLPPGAEVLLTDGALHPIVRARPDATGRAIVPLPMSQDAIYRLVGTAFGHAQSDAVVITLPHERDVLIDIPPGGRIRVTVRDPQGSRVVSRIRLVPQDGAPPVHLGPDSRAAGAIDTMITTDGDAIISAPAGKYRVLVTRGPEWSMHSEDVQVTDTFRPDVHAVLTHVVQPGDWLGADFHVHAAPSPDSKVTLEDRVASLVAEGIEFAVPTDHNHVTDYMPTVIATRREELGSIPGAEITSWDPNWGHFNGLGLPVLVDEPGQGVPAWEKTTPAQIFRRVHELDPDALVQINHPRMEGEIGYFDRVHFDPATQLGSAAYSADYDLIEVWNGFDLARPASFERVFNEWLELVAEGHRYVATGNSDSHLIRYQWNGYPRTYVRARGYSDARQVLRELRAGHAFVTSGPFLDVTAEGGGPGDRVRADHGNADVHVRVQIPSWMHLDEVRIYVSGQLMTTDAISPLFQGSSRYVAPLHAAPLSGAIVFEKDYDVPIEKDGSIVVLIRGTTPLDEYFARNDIPPLAFSNPIWVDADGDGRWQRDPRRAGE